MEESGWRTVLRHVLATIAYRGGKALRGVPNGFGTFEAGGGVRRPVQILAHMSDRIAWIQQVLATGDEHWEPSTGAAWEAEVDRFYARLSRLDTFLSGDAELRIEPRRLLQGPLSDVLTHVGQLAMLRRLAGAPIPGENFYRADIRIGRVGPEQSPPVPAP